MFNLLQTSDIGAGFFFPKGVYPHGRVLELGDIRSFPPKPFYDSILLFSEHLILSVICALQGA